MQKIKSITKDLRLASLMKRHVEFGQWVEEISRIMNETTVTQVAEKGEK